ncbi:hypothetical protein [Enterobacter phage 01_vB_Eclo_IJM]|nr:hypothetical protein [Enterobacter phage 01_vB_Eclo_IJM]
MRLTLRLRTPRKGSVLVSEDLASRTSGGGISI